MWHCCWDTTWKAYSLYTMHSREREYLEIQMLNKQQVLHLPPSVMPPIWLTCSSSRCFAKTFGAQSCSSGFSNKSISDKLAGANFHHQVFLMTLELAPIQWHSWSALSYTSAIPICLSSLVLPVDFSLAFSCMANATILLLAKTQADSKISLQTSKLSPHGWTPPGNLPPPW